MAEGVFPKVDGNKLYASEVNSFFRPDDDSIFTGADGALNVSSGTTNLSGKKEYSSVSITGGTVNITDWTIINVSGNVTISGTPTIAGSTVTFDSVCSAFEPAMGPVNYGATEYAAGGSGGKTKYPLIMFINGNLNISGGTFTFSGGNGSAGSSVSDPDVDETFNGASGGGGSFLTAGGAGTDSGDSKGGRPGGVLSNLFSVSEYFNLVNLPFTAIGGSGGRGGAGWYKYRLSEPSGTAYGGGGGGSAGSLIYFYVNGNVSITGGTFNLAGGNGASFSGNNGGGGAGGVFCCLYGGTYSNSGTVTLTGGSGGTSGSAGVEIAKEINRSMYYG